MLINYNDVQALEINTKNSYDELNSPAGVEHYKLLAYLSTQINGGIIFDIGTHFGLNALALSYNKNNTVFTFDICDKISEESKKNIWCNNNVTFSTDNLFDEKMRNNWKDKILASSFIFLDVEPHEGSQEYKFHLWLKENNY